MSDYIRREDILKWQKTGTFANGICLEAKACVPVDYIESLEPADVAPVVHGRWIKYTGIGKVQWMCSECSAEEKNPKVANYCYHCGAKMDGERVSNEHKKRLLALSRRTLYGCESRLLSRCDCIRRVSLHA